MPLTPRFVDFSDTSAILASVRKAAMDSPQYLAAKRRLGDDIADTWRGAVSGTQLAGMPFAVHSTTLETALRKPVIHASGNLISVQMAGDVTRPDLDAAGNVTGGLSALEIAEHLERGHGQIDMREKLLNSPRAKYSKADRRYIVVPLGKTTEAGVPSGSIPERFQRKLAPYERRQAKFAPKTSGERQPYGPGSPHMVWGRRTTATGYRQQFGHLSGLRGADEGNRHGSGAGYLSFRTVTEDSPAGSWVIPARPANPIRQAVIDDVLRRWGSGRQLPLIP